MEYTPISPFMRPISHAHLRVVERPEASVPGKPVNKWELLRELSKAQAELAKGGTDVLILTEAIPLAEHLRWNDTPGAIAAFAELGYGIAYLNIGASFKF